MDIPQGSVGAMLAQMGPEAALAYAVLVGSGAALLLLGARPVFAVLKATRR